MGWDNNPDKWTKSAGHHYQLQDLNWIKSLKISGITDDDCCLFLWVTDPILQKSFEVMKSWGFKYSTVAFTWVKTTKNGKWHYGCGSWTRANPEMCLLATIGHPKRINRGVRQLIISPVGEHSKKPSDIRKRIIELVGDLPRIELFARPPKDRLFEDESYKGWDLWGNEC